MHCPNPPNVYLPAVSTNTSLIASDNDRAVFQWGFWDIHVHLLILTSMFRNLDGVDIEDYFIWLNTCICDHTFKIRNVTRQPWLGLLWLGLILGQVLAVDLEIGHPLHLLNLQMQIHDFMGLLPDTQNCGCAVNAWNVFPPPTSKETAS